MPELGEIRTTKELGYKWAGNYIYHACEICGKGRWVQCVKGKPLRLCCIKCTNQLKVKTGSDNPAWKGGRSKLSTGYVLIRLQPDDFFYSMTDKRGHVLEHRLVVAKRLGRCLHPWEIVHHKDHIRDHNDGSNLYLAMDASHNQITHFEKILKEQQAEIKVLQERVTLLEAEKAALRAYSNQILEKEPAE